MVSKRLALQDFRKSIVAEASATPATSDELHRDISVWSRIPLNYILKISYHHVVEKFSKVCSRFLFYAFVEKTRAEATKGGTVGKTPS